ncbi:MAG: SatD family protein [Gammaproteobacteria bacterium]|nr:SatD family protein [Gammaproteobacteria bacterium]
MLLLVLIGDLVASRETPDRQSVQDRLRAALDERNTDRTGIASPYTITLGDEFQAVLENGERAFKDAVSIQAAVHPVLVRFSIAIGELSTKLNPHQAIGMDGPAFHQARAGIEDMRQSYSLFRLQGLPSDLSDIVAPSLNLVSHEFGKWQSRRFDILAAIQRRERIADIARCLNVSEQAVYKNISEGRLRDVSELFEALGRSVNDVLASPSA